MDLRQVLLIQENIRQLVQILKFHYTLVQRDSLFVGAVIAFVEKDPKFGQFNLPISLLVFVWALVMPHEQWYRDWETTKHLTKFVTQ